MTEEKSRAVFCGTLPTGSGGAFMQFVMGKLDLDWDERTLLEAFTAGEVIPLIEPIVIQRVPVVQVDERTGKQTMVMTHQFVEDPYWPVRRNFRVPVSLGKFLSVRCMDLTNAKDMEEIARYENSLQHSFQAALGLVKPTPLR